MTPPRCSTSIGGVHRLRCVRRGCPVDACFAEDELPDQWQKFTQINADYSANAKQLVSLRLLRPGAPGTSGTAAAISCGSRPLVELMPTQGP